MTPDNSIIGLVAGEGGRRVISTEDVRVISI
jgi:hypothetical protein